MSDIKLLAVYDDLLKRIEEAKSLAKDGRDGADGKDGKDAPDLSPQLFAAMGALHAELAKQVANMRADVTVSPEITINRPYSYLFTVERDEHGFISRIHAESTEA